MTEMFFNKNMRLCLAPVLLLAAVSCASPSLVAKAAATETYYAASYQHKCQNTGGKYPADCARCKDVINDGIWKIITAQTNSGLGYMPPQQEYELQQLIAALESCP